MTEQVEPSRQAFERGDSEQAVRVFLDSVVGPGGFERFPPPARWMILDNAPEFRLEVNSAPEHYYAAFACHDLKKVQVPTLLLTGAESPKFFHQMTYELEKCMSKTERATIPHASHGMHNQNPQAYNETVLAFLVKH